VGVCVPEGLEGAGADFLSYSLVVEEFWELGPLNRAVAKLGQG